MSTRWVLVGCGYTGTRLARVLVEQGDRVTVTRREGDAARELAGRLGPPLVVSGVRADLGDPETLHGIVPPDAIVVCLAPPGSDPVGEMRALVAATSAARKLVYVSSTGVYGAAGGAWVDESWPLAPLAASGQARVAAEHALAATAIPYVVLRVAGIHGPGRGIADRMRAGGYRILGDGSSHISRIHVDDLVDVIVRAGRGEATGVFNVADDDPAPIGEVADAIAARLGLPPPERQPAERASPEAAAMLTADRRISNRRLKAELGVTLRYPSWRDALP